MTLKRRVRAVAHRFGYDVVALRSSFGEQQRALLSSRSIELLMDVGANEGQYAQKLRALGYSGRIRSYEPSTAAFHHLTAAAAHDPAWDIVNVAVGDVSGESLLNISRNSVSSSLLDMEAKHLEAAPASLFTSSERVQVIQLDDELPFVPERGIWLKIDTQGFEDRVLRGASSVLSRCSVVQCELSLVPLYRGGPDWLAMCGELRSAGFRMVGVEPGVQDAHGRELLQLDGLFLRDDDTVGLRSAPTNNETGSQL